MKYGWLFVAMLGLSSAGIATADEIRSEGTPVIEVQAPSITHDLSWETSSEMRWLYSIESDGIGDGRGIRFFEVRAQVGFLDRTYDPRYVDIQVNPVTFADGSNRHSTAPIRAHYDSLFGMTNVTLAVYGGDSSIPVGDWAIDFTLNSLLLHYTRWSGDVRQEQANFSYFAGAMGANYQRAFGESFKLRFDLFRAEGGLVANTTQLYSRISVLMRGLNAHAQVGSRAGGGNHYRYLQWGLGTSF